MYWVSIDCLQIVCFWVDEIMLQLTSASSVRCAHHIRHHTFNSMHVKRYTIHIVEQLETHSETETKNYEYHNGSIIITWWFWAVTIPKRCDRMKKRTTEGLPKRRQRKKNRDRYKCKKTHTAAGSLWKENGKRIEERNRREREKF